MEAHIKLNSLRPVCACTVGGGHEEDRSPGHGERGVLSAKLGLGGQASFVISSGQKRKAAYMKFFLLENLFKPELQSTLDPRQTRF